ncbi:MAG TPA: hypothetical protein VE604_01875 [Candidatus Polarisedimenticolia bacterium]|jgi:hypothetical protein|nr:hypothetical protein [Candidatus Polarisedimenticolia bacterium]
MQANKRFSLFLALAVALVIITGCGGGTSLSFPPPVGSFTNANLSGPFAFSYTGSDASGFLAVAGSFVADGAGNLTSGTQDINSGLGVRTNAAITGTYVVRADGRGTANLNSPAGNTTLDFVIVASGHALVTRFDNRATGSGTIDQQTSSAFSNAVLAGPFAFSLSGIDTGGIPLAVGGIFTSDASGTLTAGVDDSNDNGVVVTNDPMTGSIPMTSTGRGTATLNTSRGALTFAYYVVDANHLKIVGTNTLPALGGEAFRQLGPFTNASVSGPFAFTLAGADLLSRNPFAAGGVVTSDGAGNLTNGIEDINDAGFVNTNVPFTGTYTMAANGRGTMTLTTTAGTFTFAIYPSSGGVILLETDVRFLTTGTALQQQTTPFTAGSLQGTYGLNFTASNNGSELDSIAEFTADGASKLTGIIDLNNSGGITFGQPLSGTFTVAANGRTTMALQTPLGTQNLVVYLVNGTRALFVEIDGAVVAAGDIRHQ